MLALICVFGLCVPCGASPETDIPIWSPAWTSSVLAWDSAAPCREDEPVVERVTTGDRAIVVRRRARMSPRRWFALRSPAPAIWVIAEVWESEYQDRWPPRDDPLARRSP